MIEMLHAAEVIRDLLHDPDLQGTDLVSTGERQERGVGVIEAPRGTLIHHYKVDDNDQIVRCNLIVSTTHNNQAMNEAIRQVARQYIDGRKLTEGLLNHIEVAIRAFDPCLSCATHALGKMPLEVELLDAEVRTGRSADAFVGWHVQLILDWMNQKPTPPDLPLSGEAILSSPDCGRVAAKQRGTHRRTPGVCKGRVGGVNLLLRP